MAPGPMPGNQAQGMAAVKLAVEALQKALPALPMGSDLHTAVLNALTGVTKHMDDNGPQPGGDQSDMIQQLVALARQGQSGSPLGAMMPPGGGAPPPGAAPPPPPPGM